MLRDQWAAHKMIRTFIDNCKTLYLNVTRHEFFSQFLNSHVQNN